MLLFKKQPLFFQYKIILGILLLFVVHTVQASFEKQIDPQWTINNPLSNEVISHQVWQNFLDHNVITNNEKINLIDYSNLSKEDLESLKNYIKVMSQINIEKYNKQEQLAYWLNLYNALTVQTVANYYPVANIQEINISPGLFSVGPWGANIITIKNVSLSLDAINNHIIRPVWNDARTHYALNNATIGAPNLSKEAFQGAFIDRQLNQVATEYVNSLRGAQVIEGKLIISKIYDWYETDFGGTKQNVINHLLLFGKEPLLSQLKHINTVDSYSYNWHINCTSNLKA